MGSDLKGRELFNRLEEVVNEGHCVLVDGYHTTIHLSEWKDDEENEVAYISYTDKMGQEYAIYLDEQSFNEGEAIGNELNLEDNGGGYVTLCLYSPADWI